APRRSSASTHAAERGDVRQGAAQPERRAREGGHPVEIRLQEREVDRTHSAHRRRAENGVEQGGATGIRLLLQRQPHRRPPALEPGHRAPHRGVPTPQDAHVQRLRGPGRVSVQRDGSEEVLLRPVSRRARVALKAAVWVAGFTPLAKLLYGFWTSDLT